MKAIRLLLVSFFVLSIAFTGNSMGAGTSTGTIFVQAEAAVVCVIGSATIDLGTYTGSSIDVNDSFNVQCSDTTPYTISYGEGINFLGGERWMDGLTGTNLRYVLYCELSSGSGSLQECGDGIIGSLSADTGTGLVQPFAISVSIPPEQFVPAGTYSDQIVTTLTY